MAGESSKRGAYCKFSLKERMLIQFAVRVLLIPGAWCGGLKQGAALQHPTSRRSHKHRNMSERALRQRAGIQGKIDSERRTDAPTTRRSSGVWKR